MAFLQTLQWKNVYKEAWGYIKKKKACIKKIVELHKSKTTLAMKIELLILENNYKSGKYVHEYIIYPNLLLMIND